VLGIGTPVVVGYRPTKGNTFGKKIWKRHVVSIDGKHQEPWMVMAIRIGCPVSVIIIKGSEDATASADRVRGKRYKSSC